MRPFSSSLRFAAWLTWVLGVAATLPGLLGGCTRAACGQGCDGADVCVDGACRTPCNAEDDCPRRNHCDNGLCVAVEEGASSSSSTASGATAGTSSTTGASRSGSSGPPPSSRPGGSSAGGSSAASASASTGSSLSATSLAPSSSLSAGSSSSLAAASSSGAAASSSSQSGTPVGSSSSAGSTTSLTGSSASLPAPSSSLAAVSSSSAAPPSSSAAPSSSTCMPESAAQFCQRHNANCGLVLDVDNCGTSRNQVCGLCSGSDVCTPQRQCCTPETDQQLCAAAGAQCGPINVVDGCLQNRSVSCGDCPGSANCTNNMCTVSGWVFLGVGNSTFAGTTPFQTIGMVPGNAVELAIAVWGGEDEDLDVAGNQQNYTVTFQGSTACTRSNAPWPMPEGECFLRSATANFLVDGNYPTAAISECAIRYDVTTRVVEFQDQSAAEDCAFAIFYRLP